MGRRTRSSSCSAASPSPTASAPQVLVFKMAAFNKLGGLLRHSALASRVTASSSPAVFSAARLMSTKLFVGGLDWGVDDVKLRDAFSSFGEVTEARVIMDRDSGRSRGFGFVNFANSDEANKAVSEMDGQPIGGRPVRVNIATDRPAGNRGGGGYGGGGFGGGGGYGGGGYGSQSYGS